MQVKLFTTNLLNMRTTKLLLLAHVINGLILIVNSGCIKEKPTTRVITPPPPTVVNTPPTVYAGVNIGVYLPVDSAFLSGSATDAENNIDSYKWRQLSGPGQAIIYTPDSLKTKISKLIKGEYSFELTVIDKGNLSEKASVKVFVYGSSRPAKDSAILKVLDVICWGPECTVLVDTSNTIIYRDVPIRVFLKSMDSAMWVEIPQQNYFFSSNREHFWIEWYGLDDTKEWEVKVVY
jgi:hypothetical protein